VQRGDSLDVVGLEKGVQTRRVLAKLLHGSGMARQTHEVALYFAECSD
jgi:hypothetical protein